MSTATYAPRAGSVAERVIRFLADNPDEVLTTDDIAVKFEASRNNVHSLLAQAVAAGLLVRAEDPGESELVYRAGQGRVPAPAPAPATPFSAHRPFQRRPRRAPAQIDVGAIRLEDNVPQPWPDRSLAAQMTSLLLSMRPGQSFAVDLAARHSLRSAITALKKSRRGQWTARAQGAGELRCWRLS